MYARTFFVGGYLSIFYRTFLKDCPFVIKFRATKDGDKLYIKEIGGEHNHDLSEVRIILCSLNMAVMLSINSLQEVFHHMPKQRRLDSEAKQEAVKLLALRANKKLVQNHLMSLTSKTVTLKDIHNIAGKAAPSYKNDFQELVKEMKKVKCEE